MPYPIHLNLDEEVEKELIDWTEVEIINHLSEREEWIEKLKRHQTDYIAEPQTEVADFPFLGAATIMIPLTAIAMEAVHSRTMQTLWSLDQRIAAKIRIQEQVDLEPELERFLEEEVIEATDFIAKTEPAILELEKLGTGVIETSYVDTVKKGVRTLENGEEEDFEVVVKRGPSVDSVPLANFLMPFDCTDPQTARWCGKVFWLTPNEIKQRERDGYFKEGTYDDLESLYHANSRDIDSAGDYESHVEDLQKMTPAWPKDVEFYWLATEFIVDGSDAPREIFYVYQRETRKIVSIWNNWFNDLRRPFRTGVYFPLEFRWTGIGIAKQNEQFQYEVTAQHRSRLDNATIANMRMFKVNRNANIKPDEPIFPGKLWFVDDMNDIMPMEMGDVKASAYNNENQVIVYSQQRTGVNELTLGMPNVGTPGTATDSMARVQESARKFDYSFGNTKKLLNQVVQDTVCNLVQWKPDIRRLEFSPKGGEIESFLKQEYDLFRSNIILKVELVGQNQNKYRDRQDATQLVGMFQQYYGAIMGLIEQTAQGDPAVLMDASGKAMDGANLAMRHILQSFDIRNPERYIITPPKNGSAQPINPAGSPNPAGGIGSTSSVQSNLILAPNASSVLPNLPQGMPGMG